VTYTLQVSKSKFNNRFLSLLSVLELHLNEEFYLLVYITPCSLLKTNVSEEYVVSIFMVEEYFKHEMSVKQVSFLASSSTL
jgi:hypothetical protein